MYLVVRELKHYFGKTNRKITQVYATYDYCRKGTDSAQTPSKRSACRAHARVFKTGKGDYGEGDIFWGIRVPIQRTIAKKVWRKLSPDQWHILMEHPVHEARLTALFILTHWYEKAKTENEKKEWVQWYIDYRIYQ